MNIKLDNDDVEILFPYDNTYCILDNINKKMIEIHTNIKKEDTDAYINIYQSYGNNESFIKYLKDIKYDIIKLYKENKYRECEPFLKYLRMASFQFGNRV